MKTVQLLYRETGDYYVHQDLVGVFDSEASAAKCLAECYAEYRKHKKYAKFFAIVDAGKIPDDGNWTLEEWPINSGSVNASLNWMY